MIISLDLEFLYRVETANIHGFCSLRIGTEIQFKF